MRVFVAPSPLRNTGHASNGRAAISPGPLGCEGPYWRRRASDICRYALPGIDMPCPAGSWAYTSLGLPADSHFSASPFEAALVAHSVFFPSSLLVEASS